MISSRKHESSNKVTQRHISAGHDNVARDKNTTNNIHYSERQTQIDGWLLKLAQELDENPEFRVFVDNLQYYMREYEYDDVVGLQKKLDHAGRKKQYKRALRRKEAFAKLLEDWRSYPAAQEIFAFFLAQIEANFETHIEPILGSANITEIDRAIDEYLVEPVLERMGTGPFMLNHLNVSGMVYWLAEQCYIRWHK